MAIATTPMIYKGNRECCGEKLVPGANTSTGATGRDAQGRWREIVHDKCLSRVGLWIEK